MIKPHNGRKTASNGKKTGGGGPAASKSKSGAGKSKAKKSTISVQSSTVVESDKAKGQVMVKEKYKPTGKGRAKTGLTVTKKSPTARNASQSGRSDRASDRQRTARAPGRRVQKGRSGKGSVYYEYRENRSDASTAKRI